MTEPMTMNRLIHAAVRRDLDRLSTGLERLADGDRPRADQLARAHANLQQELTRHHEEEDTYLWPMLRAKGVDPGLLAEMESEHHAMAEALAETATAMSTLAGSGSAADAAAARASVVHTQVLVERHLAHEEKEVEPQLLRYADSPEWKAVEKKLRRQPPGVAARFFAWLTDGMSEDNRAYLKTVVPAPVVAVLARTFGRRYYREVAAVWRS